MGQHPVAFFEIYPELAVHGFNSVWLSQNAIRSKLAELIGT
jgi:hypothetical protein